MTELWHCIRLSVCVILKLWCFRYSWTWFVITIFELWCNLWMLRTGCICGWWPLDLLQSWLYVRMWFEILRDLTDYRDYMGLSLASWLCKWSLSGLISYNLGSSVTWSTSLFIKLGTVMTTEHGMLGDWSTNLFIKLGTAPTTEHCCWHFLASLLKIDHISILRNGTRNVGCWHTVTIATSER